MIEDSVSDGFADSSDVSLDLRTMSVPDLNEMSPSVIPLASIMKFVEYIHITLEVEFSYVNLESNIQPSSHLIGRYKPELLSSFAVKSLASLPINK